MKTIANYTMMSTVMLILSACTTNSITSEKNRSKSLTKNLETLKQPTSRVKLENIGFFIHPKTKAYYTSRNSTFALKASQDEHSHIEVAIDNNSFRRYGGPLSFDHDGAHIVRYRSVGPFNEKGPVGTMKVFVDNDAPALTTSWIGPHHAEHEGLSISTSSKLALDAEDALSGTAKIFVRMSASAKPMTYSKPLSFRTGGHTNIWIAAADNVGNLSAWQKLSFFVDNTPPNITAEITGTQRKTNGLTYIGRHASLVIKPAPSSKDLDFIEYRIGDGPISKYTESVPLAAQNTTLSFRAIDRVGNIGKWQNLSATFDDVKPKITLTPLTSSIKNKGIIYAKPGFALKVRAKDLGAGLKEIFVSDDQDKFIKMDESRLTFKEPGVHHVVFRATDTVGNMSQTDVISIFIDNQVEDSYLKPKQKLVKHGSTYLTRLPNSLTIIGNDSGVGIQHIEYSYDGNVFHKITGPIDLSMWNKSKRTLHYRSVDLLGNMEETKSISITIQRPSKDVEVFVGTGAAPSQSLKDIKKTIEKAKQISNDRISKADDAPGTPPIR